MAIKSSQDMTTPFRFRKIGQRTLISNEAGDFKFFENTILENFFNKRLTTHDRSALRDLSILIEPEANWRLASLMRRVRSSKGGPANIGYLIVVPTLRCNFTCKYCQVSRAPVDSKGFDWDERTLEKFESFLDIIDTPNPKIEIQGGEPTLRPDLIREIINISERRLQSPTFVICTNLSNRSEEIDEIFSRENVYISTSLDGNTETTTENRTGDNSISQRVLSNIEYCFERYGEDKISALPTITEQQYSNPDGLIDLYQRLGFRSIFLRPVNYVGFARKAFGDIGRQLDNWEKFYLSALDHIREVNRSGYFEEFYLAMQVRRILANISNKFVDARSPSRLGMDYCVIDFDETLYPTDEARMLSRTKVVDLSIGNLDRGILPERLEDLNLHGVNQVHPDCSHCVYMPYCGIDLIDDISRYGTIDIPKQETSFCRRQMFLFDFIFEKLESQDRKWLDLFLRWTYKTSDESLPYGSLQ